MSTAMKRIIVSAVGLGLGVVLATAYALHANRYISSDELMAERREQEQKREYAARLAAAKTDDQKLELRFEERVADRGAFARELKKVRVSDGIDRYEAWLLARQYFREKFGICGDTSMPIWEGEGRWRVPMAYGSGARPGTIWIAAATGTVTCDTPSPVEFIEAQRPNQPPEPTAMAVTPPAAQEPRQP